MVTRQGIPMPKRLRRDTTPQLVALQPSPSHAEQSYLQLPPIPQLPSNLPVSLILYFFI